MDKRLVIIFGVVGGLVALLVAAANLVTSRPLDVSDVQLTGQERDLQYARTMRFSEPAIAGMVRFGDHCAACHGPYGEGSETAPGLLEQAFALTHLNREDFHTELGRSIAAHRALMRGGDSVMDFNTIEMMAKYLREIRVKGAPPPIDG